MRVCATLRCVCLNERDRVVLLFLGKDVKDPSKLLLPVNNRAYCRSRSRDQNFFELVLITNEIESEKNDV